MGRLHRPGIVVESPKWVGMCVDGLATDSPVAPRQAAKGNTKFSKMIPKIQKVIRLCRLVYSHLLLSAPTRRTPCVLIIITLSGGLRLEGPKPSIIVARKGAKAQRRKELEIKSLTKNLKTFASLRLCVNQMFELYRRFCLLSKHPSWLLGIRH
jgi:hypothetical protein